MIKNKTKIEYVQDKCGIEMTGRKFFWIIFLSIALGFLLGINSLEAATYYIDQTDGLDTDSGLTTELAWKTVAKVNGFTFASGDSILFENAGENWREQLTVPRNNLYFGTYSTGDAPVINGADLITNWVSAGANKYYHLGMSIQPKQVFLDSTKGTLAASSVAVDAQDEWFWTTSGSDTLFIYTTTAADTLNLEASQRGLCIYINDKDSVTVDGINTTKAGAVDTAPYNVRISAANYCTLKNFTTTHGYHSGIGINSSSDHNLVYNVIATLNGEQTGVGIGVWNPGADANEISTCYVYSNFYSGITNHGLEASTDGPDSTWIHDCQSYSNGNRGISVTMAKYTIVENNLVYSNTAEGIKVGSGDLATAYNDGNIIRYNTVYSNQYGIYFFRENNFQCYYNLVYLNTENGIYAGGFNGGTIYNNTVYSTVNYAIQLSTAWGANCLVKNNIGYVSTGKGFAGIYAMSSVQKNQADSSWVSDYNLFYDANGYFSRYDATQYNFADWQDTTGQDAASLNVDPELADTLVAGGYDFSLLVTSDAINAGVSVGLTVDILGNPIMGLPDIGAYESSYPYYVDATGGNDANDGLSTTTAWQTIAKVNASTFSPGDSILFKKGETWTGTQLTISSSGTAANYITYASYGAGSVKPVIDGNNTLTRGIYATGKSYVKVDGFTVKKMKKTGYTYAINFLTGAYNTVTNCTVSEVYYVTNPTPGSTAWEFQYGSGIEFTSNGGEISNNTITDCGSQGINYGTTNGAPISNQMLIYGNDISNCNIMLRVSTGSFQNGVAIKNVKIYDNNFHDHNAYYRCDAWHRNGIQIFCSAYASASFDSMEIYNNYFYDYTNHTIGQTAWLYIENICKNFKIHHNIFGQGCGYYAIRILGKQANFDANHEIYNNTIGTMYQTATDLNGIGIEEAYGCKIKNNIIYSQRIAYSVPDVNADSGFAADYNLIVRLDGGTDLATVYGGVKDFAELKAAGLETNGILVGADSAGYVMTNRLANPAVYTDFALRASSLAIDTGSDLDFTTDYQDSLIPKGSAPDIGALEFLQPPEDPAPPDTTTTVNIRATQFTVSFTPTSDSTKISYQKNGGTKTWLVSYDSTVVSVTVYGLTPGADYVWYFVAKTTAGEESGEAVISFTARTYTRRGFR